MMNTWTNRPIKLFQGLFLACLTVVTWSACAVQHVNTQKNMHDLQVTLGSVTGSPKVGAPIELSFSVANAQEKAQKFCQYMTPFEGFNGDIMGVMDAKGNKIAYQGINRKCGAPTAADDIPVGPGETRSVTFDLQEAYPISQPGNYTVQFKGSEYLNRLPDSNVLKLVVGR
ncbi:MAG: hypothetical protein RLZZ165_1709 [Bacteroidota bacterium]